MLMTKTRCKVLLIAGLSLLLLFGGICSSFGLTAEAKAAAGHHLVYEHDRLTLKTDMTSLVQLVEEIAAAVDIEIVTASPIYADQFVSADIKDWSVIKVMQALLGGYNYLILFSVDAPRQGLHLMSGTASAPAGEKLLVLTEDGLRYKPMQGKVPSAANGKSVGMPARISGGLSGPVPAARNSMQYHAQRHSADSIRENLFLPASVNEKKEEKIEMQTRETSYPEATAAEKNVSAMNGTDRSGTEDDGGGLGEYDDAAVPYDYLPDDNEAVPEESVEASFAREDYLRYQIDKLTARIESGYSDRQYEFWSQKRDPKYVTNDRDLLTRYEQELRAIADKE